MRVWNQTRSLHHTQRRLRCAAIRPSMRLTKSTTHCRPSAAVASWAVLGSVAHVEEAPDAPAAQPRTRACSAAWPPRRSVGAECRPNAAPPPAATPARRPLPLPLPPPLPLPAPPPYVTNVVKAESRITDTNNEINSDSRNSVSQHGAAERFALSYRLSLSLSACPCPSCPCSASPCRQSCCPAASPSPLRRAAPRPPRQPWPRQT